MNNDQPAELISFRRYLKRRNYASNTVRCYLNDLTHFLKFVAKPADQVVPDDVDRYIEAQQEEGRVATTINRRLSAVRQLYVYLRVRQNATRFSWFLVGVGEDKASRGAASRNGSSSMRHRRR